MGKAEPSIFHPFYDPSLERASLAQEMPVEYPPALLELLQDPSLHDAIALGTVTLGIIRPHVGEESNSLGLSDAECAEEIEWRVNELGLITRFSLWFSEVASADFYGNGPREAMQAVPASGSVPYCDRWEEFRTTMISGPSTVMLLHSPSGDAAQIWRRQMGKVAGHVNGTPGTIRGDLAVNRVNDLVHGSDSPQDVMRELAIITACIQTDEQPMANKE